MPGARIIGVYALPVDDDMVTTQARILSGAQPTAEDLAQARRQLESAALIEVLVTDADAHFDLGDFAQADPRQPRENWQAPWAEVFLMPDGERLLGERSNSPPRDQASFRVAFYLHYWMPGQPLLSSYGTLTAPPPSPMPERLKRFAPYEFLD